jgi:ABC-type Fe3+ transport system substrate-binding protein
LAYNPKLISKADLPKMLKDFGDPKYKGKFAVPPYTGTPGMIMLAYGKEKALDIYRTWGKNKPKVLTYNQGLNRLALGELWMAPYPNSYDVFKQQARGNPVDMVPIQDLVPWTPRYMTVRANAPHINAARLWALFNTGPQAQRIWEKEAKWMNITYPEQSRIKEVIKLIDASGAKIYSWEENEQNFKKLLWYAQTKKGRAYSKKIKSALRKGR